MTLTLDSTDYHIHHQAFGNRSRFRVNFPFQTLAVAMDGERDCSSAGWARRRRERRQRSRLRYEQLSVKMALSAALHHSRGVGPELHEAPRGPKTDRAVEEEVREVNDALEGQKRPPPGERPAPLPEVAGPQAAVLLVFSAMLGSTVAPGDDFVDMVVFSAMLGSTLDTWCFQSSWPLHMCSSWTRLFCLDPEVPHNGGSAVAVPLQGRQHPRRCAETASHGLTSETIEILLLQYIDIVVDVGCASPASPCFDAGHCRSHACCCATTGALAGRDSAESVGVPQLALFLGQVDMPTGVSTF